MEGYIIKPEDWNYDGINPSFTDVSYGFTVEVVPERDGSVKLLGSSTSFLDDSNCCFYDLSCDSFTNRAYNNVFCEHDDMFDKNENVCIDVTLPDWFVEHCAELISADMEYDDILRCAVGDDDGVFDSIGKLRDVLFNYLTGIGKIATPSMIYDILYVAERMGTVSHNNRSGKYYVMF